MNRFFRDFFRLVGRYRRGLFTAFLGLLGIWCALLFTSYRLSTDTEFCGSCHYEQPYIQSWTESHHADVDCNECHQPHSFGDKLNRAHSAIGATLKYWTGTHDKIPQAVVDDRNCLQSGCHDGRLSEGPEEWIKGIAFNHDHHVGVETRGMRLHCSSCHSQIVQGSHMEVTPETCFLCHFKNLPRGEALSGCNCHSAPEEIVLHEGFEFRHTQYLTLGVGCEDCHVNVTTGDGEVPKTVCWGCHTVRLDSYDDVEFTHRKHVVEHNVDCAACHQPIGHHDVEYVKSIETSCTECHGGSHTPQRDVFMGIGAEGVEPYPSIMFKAQVGCDGCHRGETPDEHGVARATGDACVMCHGLGFDRMLEDWHRMTNDFFARIDPLYQQAASAVASAGDRLTPEATQAFERARHNLDFLKAGRPEHNLVYSKLTLLEIQDDLNQTLAAARPDWRKQDLLAINVDDLQHNCTQTCHANMRETKHVMYAGVELTHYDHVYKHNLECTYCHDNSVQHGAVKMQRQNCLGCHHTQKNVGCTGCHDVQQRSLAGTAGFGVEDTPAIMADLACDDCHVDLHGENNRAATLQACVECHEEGYDELVAEWQSDTQNRLQTVEGDLDHFMSLIVTARARGVPTASIRRAEHLKTEALANLDHVRNDLSQGVHNPELTEALLKAADERLNEAGRLIDQPSP